MLYPPRDFQCLYQNACPYLGLLSTTWVLGEYRRGQNRYQEHLKIIDIFDARLKEKDQRLRILERENAELKAKLKMLHQRQFQPNKKKDAGAGPTQDSLSLNRKKRGAPVGHPGWVRPQPTRIDRTVFVPAPMVCPYCRKDNLAPLKELHEHVQEDIVLNPKTVITCYQHGQAFCSSCNRQVICAGEGEILNAPIGPVAKSAAIYLRYRIGVPYRKVTELFRDLFGLNFVPASALGFDRKASAYGAPIHEDLREKIRASDVVHGDETSWRNNGIGHYAWFAGNEKLAYFHIDRHRSAAVAKAIFGAHFEGILVRDRYAAYNGIGSEWQSCLAHIITKAKEIKREHSLLQDVEKDAASDRFCDRVVTLFQKACEVGRKLNAGDLPWESAKGMEESFVKRLSKICKKPLLFKPAETLRAYMAGEDQKYLFTFLRHRGVPPTNNLAEQAIRHLVIFRKICFGTRSDSGLLTHSILTSLVQTARRQGVHPRAFLQSLLTADTQTAQAALYNNSS